MVQIGSGQLPRSITESVFRVMQENSITPRLETIIGFAMVQIGAGWPHRRASASMERTSTLDVAKLKT